MTFLRGAVEALALAGSPLRAVSCTRGMNAYTCTHCGTVGLMEGFIEAAGEHSRGYARWIEGALERGVFGAPSGWAGPGDR